MPGSIGHPFSHLFSLVRPLGRIVEPVGGCLPLPDFPRLFHVADDEVRGEAKNGYGERNNNL